MKKVIYYFSGTGNSLRAAIKIAGEMGGAELISVRNAPEVVSAKDADVIGFICPVYEWDIPGAMKKFIKKLSVNPDAYIFMCCTYVLVHGRCFETVERLLGEKGTHLSYGRPIQCVASQCTAYNPFPPEKIMVPKMEKSFVKAGREIKEQKKRAFPHMSPVTRKLYKKMMIPYLNVEKEYDKGFYTSDACVGCGICEKVCPLKNITLEEKHPVWHHNCHGCMACVAYCPKKAVQFKTPEAYQQLGTAISKKLCLPEDRNRYHNPYISQNDLMKDIWHIGQKESDC